MAHDITAKELNDIEYYRRNYVFGELCNKLNSAYDKQMAYMNRFKKQDEEFYQRNKWIN